MAPGERARPGSLKPCAPASQLGWIEAAGCLDDGWSEGLALLAIRGSLAEAAVVASLHSGLDEQLVDRAREALDAVAREEAATRRALDALCAASEVFFATLPPAARDAAALHALRRGTADGVFTFATEARWLRHAAIDALVRRGYTADARVLKRLLTRAGPLGSSDPTPLYVRMAHLELRCPEVLELARVAHDHARSSGVFATAAWDAHRASAPLYSRGDRYPNGAFLRHPLFGLGRAIRQPSPGLVSVEFEDGVTRTLQQGAAAHGVSPRGRAARAR